MRNKNACIIVDLRSGQHVVNIPDIVAVLSAAGWKTRVSLKEYGGETMQLAQKAAQKKYDLVIGYGGDGTLNAVLNGVMYGRGKSLVADLPGGTYNVWAGAMGIPTDPVKAALKIVASDPYKADLGHIEIAGLSNGATAENGQPLQPTQRRRKKTKQTAKGRQYFLLNVGIGMDALMMEHISKPLKYKVGPLAFDLAMARELPHQRPFPILVQRLDDQGNVEMQWQGEAWQVYVSKVPLFGGSINLDPGSRADDGVIYVCLVVAGGPIKSLEQAFTLLTQHKMNKDATKYLRGTHFALRLPANVAMHVDGSIVRLEELLPEAERNVLREENDARVMVSYRFDVKPSAVRIAVPHDYNGPLFAQPHHHAEEEQPHGQQEDVPAKDNGVPTARAQNSSENHVQQGAQHKVVVIGATQYKEKKRAYILAGRCRQEDTDENEVVAMSIDDRTSLVNKEGERIAPSAVLELQEGQEIVVEGNKTKRNVIKTTCIRL